MTITTDVVHKKSFRETYRRHGYFFRQAAMLTISIGVIWHLYRVIFGDDLTMRLLLVQHRVRFANRPHKMFFTASVVYIAGSVPLHIYCSYIIWDTTPLTWFPMWFSYFLLIVVYPAFLTMFWRLRYTY